MDRWGLSTLGQQQAFTAGQELSEHLAGLQVPWEKVHFYTSPFSRTVQTASLILEALSVSLRGEQLVKDVNVDNSLRERHFGKYEKTSSKHYSIIWASDCISSDICPEGGGESVNQVADRLKAFISKIEQIHRNQVIVIVSHGDALSILAAVLQQTDLKQHREHGLGNAELLQLGRSYL